MKQALRVLARERGFSALAILTLAVGIGAVTAIFSVVDNVLLKPLSYADPGQLCTVSESAPKAAQAYPRIPVNTTHYSIWKTHCAACAESALLQPASFNLTGVAEPERVDGVRCTWELFRVLGVQPQVGRTFVATDDQPGNNKSIVIADSLWKRRYQSNPAAIGSTIRLFGEPHVIVGVLPASFRFPKGEQIAPLVPFPQRAEIFKPLGLDWPKQQNVTNFNYSMIMRLPAGASPERTQAEMIAEIRDDAKRIGFEVTAVVTRLQEQVTGGSRSALLLLLAAVGAVLMIVCVNLGNLMLVRANGRLREAAVRRALGASRLQLFRPLMTESLLLAFAGGALGLLLAYAGIRLLVTAAPPDIPRLDEVTLNRMTLLFAFLTSAGCGVLCGLWPAWRVTRSHPAIALRSGSRSTTDSRDRLNAREWLVGVEVALSTMLLIIAGLLGVSFYRVMNVNRGFDVDRVLTAGIILPENRYGSDQQKRAFHSHLLEKLQVLPGVKSAALVNSVPLRGESWVDAITKEGDTRPVTERPIANIRFISRDYFETMGVPLLRGRLLTDADRSRRVVLISEAAARKTWPGEDPLGKRVVRDDDTKHPPTYEVIGVVSDVRSVGLDKQAPLILYQPYWEGNAQLNNVAYVLRTTQDPTSMISAMRATLRSIDAELPLADVHTMQEILTESTGRRRFQTLLAGVFAASALLLACLGIYGVLSYTVVRRTNEMGVRMAMGARTSDLALMVLQQGLKPVLAGLALGIVGALWTASLLGSFLYGVGARDPWTIASVAAILLGVAAFACWIPARRASRIDPMIALRYE